MVGGSLNEGTRRRLPQWMLGVSIAKQVKPDHVKERDKQQEVVLVSEGAPSESKAVTRHPRKGRVLHKEEKLLDNPQFPVKCETNILKRKSKQDTGANGKIPKTVPEKNYNVGSETNRQSVTRKRKKAADCSTESNDELELQPLSNDAVELTVEDVIFIAEELVRADKDAEHKVASDRQHESESGLSSSTFRNTLEAFDDCNHNKTISTHNVSTSYNSGSGLMREESIVAGDGIGDPAHVMLDLFLGPLLKKPSLNEKSDFYKDDSSSAHEFEIQSQKKIAEVIVPPTKKKSSLKDKVAMLLE